MYIGICDDDAAACKSVADHILKLSIRLNEELKISVYHSAEALLESYEDLDEPFTLLILDIEMPGMSGLELAQTLRKEKKYKGELVFLTSHRQFMADSFDVGAGQYLVKPVSYPVFEKKLAGVLERIRRDDRILPFRTVDKETLFLHYGEIISLHPDSDADKRNALQIVTQQSTYPAVGILNQYGEQLAPYGFLQIHRKTLVNLRHVHKISGDWVIMTNGDKLKIGRTKKEELKKAMVSFLFPERAKIS